MSTDTCDALGDESYALRHPSQPILPIRERPAVFHRSDAEALSHAIKIKESMQKKKAMNAEIHEIHDICKMCVIEIAAKYGTKEQKIRDKVYHVPSFRHQCNVNWWNARILAKRQELKIQFPDQMYKLKEIQQKVIEEEIARKGIYSPAERGRIIDHALSLRNTRTQALRPNNRSAAQDVYRTSDRIVQEIQKLGVRTGAAGVVAITKGHQNDIFGPTTYENTAATGFCQQTLGYNPVDFAGRLECWSSTRGVGVESRQDRGTLRKECTALILNGLKQITNGHVQKMNYESYSTAIVLHYCIHLSGWLENIPMANPSTFDTVDQVRQLRDDLISGKCRWKNMEPDEFEQYKKVDESENGCTKKQRSNKKKRSGNQGEQEGNREDGETQLQALNNVSMPISQQLPPGLSDTANLMTFDPETDDDGELQSNAHEMIPSATSTIIPPSTTFQPTESFKSPSLATVINDRPDVSTNTPTTILPNADTNMLLDMEPCPVSPVGSISTAIGELMIDQTGTGSGTPEVVDVEKSSTATITLQDNWFNCFDFSFIDGSNNDVPDSSSGPPSGIYLPQPPSSPASVATSSLEMVSGTGSVTISSTTPPTTTSEQFTSATVTTEDVTSRRSSRLNGRHVQVAFD